MHKIVPSSLAVMALAASAAAAAPSGRPAMLDQLQRGQWSISSRDGSPPRAICLGNPAQLAKLRHTGSRCSRSVVEESANKVTIQYTCQGNGYGRTSIRKETATLVQIESQGIERGRPFQFKAEARRIGACR